MSERLRRRTQDALELHPRRFESYSAYFFRAVARAAIGWCMFFCCQPRCECKKKRLLFTRLLVARLCGYIKQQNATVLTNTQSINSPQQRRRYQTMAPHALLCCRGAISGSRQCCLIDTLTRRCASRDTYWNVRASTRTSTRAAVRT